MSDYKLVILGSGGVGKTACTIQFIQGSFIERYDPTIEDSYRKHFEVDGVVKVLDILDTAGQEEYSALRDSYMRTGDGFVLVFALNDPSSLTDIMDIHEQLLRSKESDEVPIVLVGNKCDLVSERAISKEECEAAVKQMGPYCRYVEASARTRTGIDEIFKSLVKLIAGYSQDVENGEVEDEPTEDKTSKQTNKKKRKVKVCSLM
ncbi:ras family small GTPase [Naegleria gruberi]|uniref:small monomeric GTPase n=1 Tax=Naegleria gruberi TaxID=5762 RepID=D2UX71_NAEGR|nr:ras family small GTPase [Naegleria gruberi]EFC50878.1 ras family small GTPase [Naegleria gruberi]|eukprot:XP_002683622.1 ras family small GTPase [Naegleria gruberi strain NEG-M]